MQLEWKRAKTQKKEAQDGSVQGEEQGQVDIRRQEGEARVAAQVHGRTDALRRVREREVPRGEVLEEPVEEVRIAGADEAAQVESVDLGTVGGGWRRKEEAAGGGRSLSRSATICE